MSFNRACECCSRSHWRDAEGEKHALEVCWSNRFDQYRCQSCHFKPTADELRDGLKL